VLVVITDGRLGRDFIAAWAASIPVSMTPVSVLAAGLAKNPDERFRRCIDFAHALAEQISTHGSASPLAPTTPAPVPSGHRAPHKPTVKSPPLPTLSAASRSLRLIIAVSIGALLVLGGILAVIWPRQPRHEPPYLRDRCHTSDRAVDAAHPQASCCRVLRLSIGCSR
jgi:hypothetical protein